MGSQSQTDTDKRSKGISLTLQGFTLDTLVDTLNAFIKPLGGKGYSFSLKISTKVGGVEKDITNFETHDVFWEKATKIIKSGRTYTFKLLLIKSKDIED